MIHPETAMELFSNGYNCAQAVLIACGENLDLTEPQMKHIASGFGGGCGQGSLCGALSGAIMALGLMSADDPTCTDHISALLSQTKQRYGGIHCTEILGCDLMTAEGRSLFAHNNLFQNTCMHVVESTVKYMQTIGVQPKGSHHE